MKKTLKIRSTLLFLSFIFLYGIVIINLYVIQIKQQHFYTQLGSEQYRVKNTLPPERAQILDRHKKPLAMNDKTIAAFIIPTHIKDEKKLKTFLSQYFPRASKRLEQNKNKQFIYVQRKLTEKQINLIQNSDIPDIKLLKEPGRFYTVPSASHIVGITNVDNKGVFGIEYMFNKQLSGTPSTYIVQKDARSHYFYFKKDKEIQGIKGKDITLTLDSDLQFLAFENVKDTVQKFKAQEGAALIMNPSTGEILAMAQYPTVNPHDTQNLALSLTKNKLATESYELGSVIKVFFALAALEEGVITPDELVDCENTKSTVIDGITINTVIPRGIIPFTEVIQYSNNIGGVKIAKRLGEKLYDHYKHVGFGKKTNLSWPGERNGFVNPPKNWSRYSIASLSFGYEISATLVQLAQAFSIIANNGYQVTPYLFSQSQRPPIKKIPLYSQKTIDDIKRILRKTVTHGTSGRAALKGYNVMGKTGTANLIIDGKYNPNHNIYTFAGIIEKGSYKRVIVTFIKDAERKNLYASMVAAPLFERIAENLVIHDHVL